MNSAVACPVLALNALWFFIAKYFIIFGLLSLGLGGYLISVGGRYYRVTMFIAGLVIVCSSILIVLFVHVLPADTPLWAVGMSFIVSLGIGSGVGFAAQKWSRVGVLIIGALVGGIFGALLYSSGFHVMGTAENQMLVLWLSIAFCSVIIAVLSMVFFDYAVIVGSAIGGAYCIVRGLSAFAGGYPNEFLIFEDYENGDLNMMPWSFFFYFCIGVMITTISILIQFRLRQQNVEAYSYRKYDFKYRRADSKL